jgi:chromate reductase, NAD(P)H dehydrogenase (quinone)
MSSNSLSFIGLVKSFMRRNMSSRIRIVGFTGSVREQSYNKAVLRAAQELLPENAELEILVISDLPRYAIEQDDQEKVDRFKEQVQQADAVLIASPAYKGMLSNTLRSALHWTGQSILAGKPTAVMGIGRQSGTVREQLYLRQILTDVNAIVLEEPEVYATSGWEKFDSEGRLVDETVREQVRALLEALVARAEEEKSALVG